MWERKKYPSAGKLLLVIIAQYFAEQPAAIIEQPDMGEFCPAAIAVGFTGFPDIKFMDAGLDHAIENSIAKKRKYFKTVSHSFADGLLFRVAADIIFYSGEKLCFVLYASLVMEKDQFRVRGFIEIVQVA